ncbi:DUF2867 domain-containing protein [Kineococcus xinjiangensis]|nr:DUF2867 domain-containing protein [Kineococcus xinjiangensis]
MRLPDTEHAAHSWRIHEVVPDFVLEDVWELPAVGGREELPLLVSTMVAGTFPANAPLAVRFLWEFREQLGRLLGWDAPAHGLGAGATSLRERLPADLRGTASEPGRDALFHPLYQLADEWAGEIANRTVHAVMHLGWVAEGGGRFRGRMAVLVRPNGRLGTAYMAAIRPFRLFLVYPALLRGVERDWQAARRGGIHEHGGAPGSTAQHPRT